MILANRRRASILLASTLLLTACGSKGPVIEPAPLTDFKARIAISTDWRKSFKASEDGHDGSQRPYLDQDRLYLADARGSVHALEMESGREAWRTDSELAIASGIGGDDSRLFIGGHDGDLLVLRKQDGEILWRSQVSSEILTPPVIAGGVVLVRTIDGRLYGLDVQDGHRLWVYESIVPSLTLHGLGQPVVVDAQVMAGFANGRLVALDVNDGHVLWEVTVAAPTGRSELERLVDIDASPVVFGSTLYAAAYQGNIVAIHVPSGRVLWTRELSTYRDLAVDESALYVTDQESIVWALDLHSGSPLWKQPGLFSRQVTAPVRHREYLVLGDFEGYLHWLDLRDGGFVARQRLDDSAVSQVRVDENGVLYAISRTGSLKRFVIKKRKENR